MVASAPRQSEPIAIRLSTDAPKDSSVSAITTSESSEKEPKKPLPRRSSRIAGSRRSNTLVSSSIAETIKKLNIRDAEFQKIQNLTSLEDLQAFVEIEDSHHQQRSETTTRGKIQNALVQIDDFGKAYGSILNGFKEAVPNGGGHAVWALLGGLFLVAQRKDHREKAITEFLSRLKYSLPRSDRYRDLYRNSATIISLHEHLHRVVIDSLLKACMYFRDKGWTGTFSRISSVMSIHDKMADVFDEVARVSAEIDAESMLEVRTEVREAHNDLIETKKEAEETNVRLVELKKQLSSATDQLTLVNDQLAAAKQLNDDLQRKLNDIHAQQISDLATKHKTTLVPESYDASAILAKCQQQIRCPSKRRQQLRQFNSGPAMQQWQTPSKKPTTSLLWVTDKRRIDSSISMVPLKVFEEHADSDVVLHSLYQSGVTSSTLPHNARTAKTVVREAIYQLLARNPETWLQYKLSENRDPSFFQLLDQFVELLDACCSDKLTSTKRIVYWLIDRMDTIFWETHNSFLRLSEAAPQAHILDLAEKKRIAGATVTLDEFLLHLCILSSRHRKEENPNGFWKRDEVKRFERNWSIKILMTSHYDMGALRRSHGIEEELQSDGKAWSELFI